MRYVGRHGRRDFSGFTPKLSVIMPCKGIDPGFADNVRSLLEQDYPDYELLFVTATEDDPARALLRDLVERHRERPTRLLVSGIQPGRSQKLNNQLFACERARPDGQALVFVDSDVRARRTFLRELVAPLANRNVGATTGFRWYIPERGGLGSYLRATWNGGGLPMLADPKLAYAWGGAMGILRQTFLRAGVAERWDKALTDDFPVTVAVRNLGLRVEFVPQCLLGSHEDASLSQVLEWTNRQTVICRVYDPALWRAIFAFHAVYVLGFVLAFAGLILSAVAPQAGISAWPFVAMFGVIPIEMGAGMLLWHTVRRILPEIGGWRRALKHALLVPAAMFLIFHNSLHSLATRDICWRGVVYRLHSPTRTEVMGTEAASGATRA
jgi:cellulose synthase/poly-beta-1,6-N-acetylglucosamine synthase-like glycosyltransferase